MKKLEGKAAIVTGASRQKGIGAAICRELAKNGCNVFPPIGRIMTAAG